MEPHIFDDISALTELVMSLPVAVFVKDAESKFRLMNMACEDQWGMSFSALRGTDASQFFPPEQVESFLEKDREVFAGGCQVDFEESFWNASLKQNRFGHTFKKPIYDELGNPLYLICITIDITDRRLAEEDIKSREERFRALFDRASEGILIISPTGKLVASNDAFARMHGYTPEEMQIMDLKDLDPPDTLRQLPERIRRIMAGETLIFEVENYHKDGSIFPLEVSSSMIVVDGEPFIQSFARDISDRKVAEERLRIASVAFETHEAIMITDANGTIIRVNRSFQEMTGYGAEEVMGMNPRILSSGRHSQEFYEDMWRHLKTNGTWSGEIWDKRKSGQIYPKWQTITSVSDDTGKITEYVAVSSDITSRKQAEEEIKTLVFYDALTGLPNRRLLMDRLHAALSISARSQSYGAVLFLDMDKFKTLNDTLGHEYGDLMLIEVSSRIQSCLRTIDTVARLGGDEFVILLEAVDESAEKASQKVALIAEKVRVTLSMPYALKDNLYHGSPSIGVCLYRGHEELEEVLLKHADIAMYQAKDSGRNAVRFFDPAMQLAVEIRANLETDLRRAVPEQQLQLYFQIQMDGDLRPYGAEALVRWFHPTRGMVSPAQFIPIAEDSSLILDIGAWVLDTACRQLKVWAKDENTKNLILAVNVSAKQFRKSDFVDSVDAVLRMHEVKPWHLKLELTESVVLSDVAEVVMKMHALKALGVKLSMDDFGTGYSSLSYLKQLPLDQVKIDQSFVRDIVTDPNDAVMVQTIISLARNFRLNVIAEGVETQAQLDFLKQNGCMAYQGYFFSRPLPIEQFEALLRQ